jgi:uncharacterized membrane protein
MSRKEDDETGTDLGRVLALSDGVFAIALTVLVLEIALPAGTTAETLGHDLAHLGPRYAAYAVSFLTIGTFWMVHRLGFRHLARTDTRLIVMNLVLLMGVAFLPFPTQVLGTFGGNTTATVFYASCMSATSLVSSTLWWYASGTPDLLRSGIDPRWIRVGRVRTLVGPSVFVATIPIAFVNPYIAEGAWFLVFPLRIVIPRLLGGSTSEDD